MTETTKKEQNEKKESKMKTIKSVIRFVVGGLVEVFIGAVTNSVVSRVDGSKAAKVGAKAGGFLVGLALADQVSNYICDEFDDTMNELDELKEAIEEEDA